MRIHVGFDRSAQIADKARKAATTALQLAPDLPEAHLAMAAIRLFFEYDHDATQRELDEAERLRPNNPEAPIARVQLEQARGNWGDGLARLIARGVELDPQNADSLNVMGLILSQMGRFADAEQLQTRSWLLSEASIMPVRYRSMNHLAWTGDVRGALDILESIPERLHDSGLFNRLRGDLHAMHGDLAAANADYERTRQFVTSGAQRTSGPRNGHLNATYSLARLEARQGHTSRATELYAEALAAARQYVSDFPDTGARVLGVFNLARAHAARGDKIEALAASQEALRIVSRTHDAYEIARARRAKAETLTVLGETDAAIAELRAVHEMGWAFGYTLQVELEWEPLRGEAKFQQLMKEAEARADAQPRPKKQQSRRRKTGKAGPPS